MAVFYEFEDVDTFTTGAIGRPGDRTFYLQLRTGGRNVSVKCEKQQVAAMAEHLGRVLVDLPPADQRPLPAALELSTPVDQVFVLGPIGLGYDRSRDRVVVQLEEMVPTGDDGEPLTEDRGQVRVHLSRDQAVAFCDHASKVVAAGRPDCPWCSLPIDPDGHPCPRMN